MTSAGELRQFQNEVSMRLRQGRHVVLYGPLGSGKSTMLAKIHQQISTAGIPCALWPATSGLDDITRAFSAAYPHVNTKATRRGARSRLWIAADQRRGVLIFDHVTRVTNAMVGYLRRLRGGVAGVTLCFDIENESQRLQIRSRHLHHVFLRMPLASPQHLRSLFRRGCTGRSMPSVTPAHEQQIIQAAGGRVGWIMHCTRLISGKRYWYGDTLHATLLCVDTELALQQRQLDFKLTNTELD